MEIIDIALNVTDEENKARLERHWDLFGDSERYDDLYASSFKWTKKDFPISAKSEADFKKLLGQRYKVCLSQLTSFIDLYQHCTSRKRVTELGISTLTPQLVEVLGYQERVSRTISLAEKCGLLVCVNNKYKFKGKGKRGEQHSKRYIYSKSVQDTIKKVVKDLGIEYKRYVRKNQVGYDKQLAKTVCQEVKDKIRVGLRLGIDRNAVTDDQIRAVLDERYPMVVACRELANEDNKSLNCREQIKCEWNITNAASGKSISKIGFRITSGIVSFKEHDNGNKNYSGVWRHEYLAEQFGFEKKVYEFDVKSSIFRVTYFLNFGEWLDNDIDLYALMSGFTFSNDEERRAYKGYKMRPYFDSSKDVVKHIMPVIKSELKDEVLKVVEQDKAREELIIGKSWSSEIFVHESCIYMMLVHRLRELGHKVIQIYDGFYSDSKDFEQVCLKELKEIAKQYRDQYISKCDTKKSKKQRQVIDEEIIIVRKSKTNHHHISINNRHEFSTDDLPDMTLSPKVQAVHDKLIADITKAYRAAKISPLLAKCLISKVDAKADMSFIKPTTNFHHDPKHIKLAQKLSKAVDEYFNFMVFYTNEPEPNTRPQRRISLKSFMDVGL